MIRRIETWIARLVIDYLLPRVVVDGISDALTSEIRRLTSVVLAERSGYLSAQAVKAVDGLPEELLRSMLREDFLKAVHRIIDRGIVGLEERRDGAA